MKHLAKALTKGGPCSSCGNQSRWEPVKGQQGVFEAVPKKGESVHNLLNSFGIKRLGNPVVACPLAWA